MLLCLWKNNKQIPKALNLKNPRDLALRFLFKKVAFLLSLHCIIRKSNKVVRGHWLLSEHKTNQDWGTWKRKNRGLCSSRAW